MTNSTETKVNLEQLRAQVERVRDEKMARVKEAAEVAVLESTLKMQSSESLFQSEVLLAVNGSQTAKLQQLVDECAGIVASVPVYNQKTRTNRVWAGSHKYNYGSQIDLMYQLATGILYSCQEHKQLLLAHTGLDLELLEQMVKGFGVPTYYSRNYHTIVEPKEFNFELAKATVEVMQSKLGVVVDTTEMTRDNFEVEFERAKNTAQENYEQAKEALKEADFSL